MAKSGVIILDSDRRIVVVTPVAEDLLGWRSSQVEGMDCRLVLDCRDADGVPLCEHCGAACALESQEMTRPRLIQVSEATGGQVSLDTTYWFLPPSGSIWEPRVMAVFSPTAEQGGCSA